MLFRSDKTDYNTCGNKEEGTLMGYSLKDDIPPEDIIKLEDGNCEDINYFKDAAEAGSRSVVINPYTGQELSNQEKEKIINKFKLNGINTFTRNGSEKPIEQLFVISSEDRQQGNIDDWATLGFFVDSYTNARIAARGQGVYTPEYDLLGIVNDWDQGNRSLLDRDNQVILRIPEDVNIYEVTDSDGEIMYKIDGIPGERRVEIRNLTDRESEMYHEQRRREDIARTRQLN